MARMGYCRHGISLKSTCEYCHVEEEQRKQADAAKDAFVRNIVREELIALLDEFRIDHANKPS